QLGYQSTLTGGLPFRAFAAASQAFPELTVEVGWNAAGEGRSGRAVIQNGILREQAAQTHSPAEAALRDARADADGRLRFAVICTRWREFWHGYAIASDQHAFFRIAGSSSAGELFASDGIEAQWAERWTVSAGDADYSELAPREPIAEDELRELDRLAQEFSREWIWFEESPLEETAVERARFADYGYPVRAADLSSGKMSEVLGPETPGRVLGSFEGGSGWI